MSQSIMDKKEQQKLAEKLVKKTHFNKAEIETLLKLHKDDIVIKQKMDRTLFTSFLSKNFCMTDLVMMDNIFRIFDQDNDNAVNMEEWVKGLSIFLRGTSQEKTKFCFEVYDLNGDGVISREEMYQLLKDSLKSKHSQDEDPEDTKRELVDICLKQLTSDNQVTFTDFTNATQSKALLIQCLGPCLPEDKFTITFEERWFDIHPPGVNQNNKHGQYNH